MSLPSGAAYLEAAKRLKPAIKTIDAEMIKASGQGTPEGEADPDAEKNFEWKLNNHLMVHKDEVKESLKLNDYGLKYWVSKGILERGPRNMFKSASVRRFLRLKSRREKRQNPAS